MPSSFGSRRLDALDLRLLEAICRHGREGQSFNKLVAEVKPFASRSTFALRCKKLQRLNYVETFGDAREQQPRTRRTRGSPLTLLLMRIVERMKKQCSDIDKLLQEEITAPEGSEAEVARLDKALEEANNRIKNVYSLVSQYGVMFGPAVAGDIILPLALPAFRKLNGTLMAFLASHPKTARFMAAGRLATVDPVSLSEDLKYAYGTELEKALPGFSRYLQGLATKS
jgi:DNA-binding Lrp family transcriptional regulator